METNVLILAYNRSSSLEGLLESIRAAVHSDPINLWVSCDKGSSTAVLDLAQGLEWSRGSYQCIVQNEHLGVDEHNIFAIQMAVEMGHMLVLEDDLILSPYAFRYLDACRSFPELEQWAGISLYRYAFREMNHFPFELLPNDEFVYFQQRPSSKGCFYTANMARDFIAYRIDGPHAYGRYTLPGNVLDWSDEIWEKEFYCYLQDTDRYVAFPRHSLSTDLGPIGVHMRTDLHSYIHQVALYQSETFGLRSFADTINRYDAHYELDPEVVKAHCPELSHLDLELDLFGTKDLNTVTSDWVISIRPCIKAVRKWDRRWRPEVNNILMGKEGSAYSLGRREHFRTKPYKGSTAEDFKYYFPDTKLSRLIVLKLREVWSRWF